jgi:hypothetical protein
MITPSKISELPADERAELEAILAEARGTRAPTDRFQSNADEASFVFYILLLGSVIGLVAYVVAFGNPFAELADMFAFGFSARHLCTSPTTAALVAIPVAAYSLWRIIANFRGNGWALTSFAFVHVVRGRVRMVRFGDIAKLEVRRFRHRGRKTVFSVITRDGAKIQSYAAALLPALRERLAPSTPVVES